MLMTVKEFCTTVGDTASLNRLVADLRRATGRGGAREEESWRSSLPILAEAVGEQYFEGIHLFFAGAGDVALEYRLPNSPKWCDVVLIGRNHERASVVIVELKHWNTASDVRGRYTGLMQRHFGDAIHPADQVQGYVEYCRAFHSAVQHRDAQVDGCVFFTQAAALAEYRAAPNESLATTYPLFSTRPAEFPAFPRYLRDRLTAPDAEFAHEFEHGRYSQPRSLCIQVGAQLADEKSSPFVLLDEQRTAFSVSMAEVTEAMSSDRKRVVIVQGPPGSGKSVVAARIWAKLAQDFGGEDRSVTMVTTSASQNSNWRSMFCQASGVRAADGFVLKANAYIPFTTHDQKAGTRDLGVVWRDASEWEKNLRLVEACGFGAKRIRDNDIGVSIVDEAHALINPEHSDGRGQFGFPVIAGPQAYHIIRGSKVVIFLLDSQQSFRERETTSVGDIERFAGMLGAQVTHVDLSDNQFRCGGSVEYTSWVEGLLAGSSSSELLSLSKLWRRDADALATGVEDAAPRRGRRRKLPTGLEFEMFSDPWSLESALRDKVAKGFSARLLSSYSVPWKTKGVQDPHRVLPGDRDFVFASEAEQETKPWSKVWNVVPDRENYAPFVQGTPGSGICEDPLAEVGCPYVVRGFDFDYIGLLWLKDLVWSTEENRWSINTSEVFESGLSRLIGRAKRGDADAQRELLRKVCQAYRILLTRPLRGVYVWVLDADTRAYISRCVAG